MIEPGQLYLLAVTVLLLAALAAAVPVLVGIVREGRQRRRRGQPRPPDPQSDDSDDSPADSHPCPHCGTSNEPGFTYCRHCLEPL
ncbi:zinc-ribbon domain-containing protein [Halomicroarcula sp. GCM10025709]|uniref:DUF7577 domain-containing protein n=1 Tax=Haloarcula TaxID=2237 RepID=UPI0024C22DF3|nr:zinc-ribbon domain-containing protein [Halomicroarcula sp. YJ-61-S]